ncbi:MAG: response regulator [Bdellovibrionales bacterium]|nr:response regulator [Bdellovibrionales bacterium]
MFNPKTRILIVDDMQTIRKQVAKLCNELGFTEIVEGADGINALQLIQHEKPPIGLVISDYDMPNANGLDLFKRIHSDTRFNKLPFILMALEAEQNVVVDALKAGIGGYLLKPFNKDDLQKKLEELQKKMGG